MTQEINPYQVADRPNAVADSTDDDAAAPATTGSGPAEAAHVSAIAVVAGAVAVQALCNVTLNAIRARLWDVCREFGKFNAYFQIKTGSESASCSGGGGQGGAQGQVLLVRVLP